MSGPVGGLARFAATFLLGVALALVTNLLSASLDGLGVRHVGRAVADGLVGVALVGGGLICLEFINHLSVRYYVLLALAAGAGMYAALAAPVCGPAVRRASSWPGRTLRTLSAGRGRSRS